MFAYVYWHDGSTFTYNVQLNHVIDIFKNADKASHFILYMWTVNIEYELNLQRLTLPFVSFCSKIDVPGVTIGLNIGNVNIIESSDSHWFEHLDS